MNLQPRAAKIQHAAYAAVAALFLTLCFTWGRHHLYGEGFFWDALVYRKAFTAWHSGLDPYAGAPTSLLFVGPPLFLRAGTLLSQLFPGHTGWYLYVAAIILAMLSRPALLTRFTSAVSGFPRWSPSQSSRCSPASPQSAA